MSVPVAPSNQLRNWAYVVGSKEDATPLTYLTRFRLSATVMLLRLRSITELTVEPLYVSMVRFPFEVFKTAWPFLLDQKPMPRPPVLVRVTLPKLTPATMAPPPFSPGPTTMFGGLTEV